MEPTLKRQIISPTSETAWLQLRSIDLTSTEIGALFGISPYVTEFELWYRKKMGLIVQAEPNDRVKWGKRLEDSIAQGIAEDNNWVVRPKKEYIRIPDKRLGASFDYEIEGGMLLEIKNVDALVYKDGWLIDGDNIEAPLHIEMQLQHQLLVSGFETGYIGALVGGNRVVLIERKADFKIQNSILKASERFWKTIDNNIAPKPDFQKDHDFIRELYSSAMVGKQIEATPRINDLVFQHEEFSAKEKEAKNAKEAIKAELLTLIGDAEKVKGEGFSISANVIGPADVWYHRDGYRSLRVFTKRSPK